MLLIINILFLIFIWPTPCAFRSSHGGAICNTLNFINYPYILYSSLIKNYNKESETDEDDNQVSSETESEPEFEHDPEEDDEEFIKKSINNNNLILLNLKLNLLKNIY